VRRIPARNYGEAHWGQGFRWAQGDAEAKKKKKGGWNGVCES